MWQVAAVRPNAAASQYGTYEAVEVRRERSLLGRTQEAGSAHAA